MGPLWDRLGTSWSCLGAPWGCLGAVWGLSWGILGSSWSLLSLPPASESNSSSPPFRILTQLDMLRFAAVLYQKWDGPPRVAGPWATSKRGKGWRFPTGLPCAQRRPHRDLPGQRSTSPKLNLTQRNNYERACSFFCKSDGFPSTAAILKRPRGDINVRKVWEIPYRSPLPPAPVSLGTATATPHTPKLHLAGLVSRPFHKSDGAGRSDLLAPSDPWATSTRGEGGRFPTGLPCPLPPAGVN